MDAKPPRSTLDSSSLDSARHRRTFLLSVGLFAVLAVPLSQTVLFDDAYIHARIARNLSETGSAQFLLGGTEKSSSSTGYTLLLGALGLVVDELRAITLMQVVTLALFVHAAVRVVNARGRDEAPVRALLIVLMTPHFLIATYGGMETGLIAVLFLHLALALERDDLRLALILGAIMCLIRIECFLLFALLLGVVITRDRSLRTLAPGLLAFSGVVALDIALFGTIVPHAAGVKSNAYAWPLSQSFGHAISLDEGPSTYFIGLFLFVAAALIAVQALRSREPGAEFIFATFAAGVLAAWSISGSSLFLWYFVLASAPIAALLVTTPRVGTSQPWIVKFLLFGALTGMAISGALRLGNQIGAIGISATTRVAYYVRIGEALHNHCPDCTLVTSEIGGLGWGFEGTVYDGFGLGDPIATSFHPLTVPDQRSRYGIGAIPLDYIRLRDPDFIVSMPIFIEDFLRSDLTRTFRRYDCAFAESDGPIWGNEGIQIFARNEIPAAILQQAGCTRHQTISEIAPA